MNVRLKAETSTTVTIEWDHTAGQQGYVPTIDSSEVLTDGKRHFSGSKTATQVKITKPTGGQPHAYGVNILGVADQGSIVIPAAGPPPPPPPPGQFGAKLLAKFPPLPAPQKLVENRTLSGGVDDEGQDVMYRGCTNTFTRHGFQAYGGAKRVQYVRNRIQGPSGGEGQPNSYQGIQSVPWQGKTPEDLRVDGGEIGPFGTSRFSHAIYLEAVKRGLVQSVLAHDIGDYVFQFYPGVAGVSSDATVVNCTVGWPRSTSGIALVVWADEGTWTCDVYNSIIWGDVQVEGNATCRLHNCVIPPQFQIDSSIDTSTCLRIDPKFTGKYVPTDPRCFTLADPGWVPPVDYKGTAYSRAVVGGVAA